MAHYEVFKDAAGEWRWRLLSGGNVVATSGEGYRDAHDAKRALMSVRMAAPLATVKVTDGG